MVEEFFNSNYGKSIFLLIEAFPLPLLLKQKTVQSNSFYSFFQKEKFNFQLTLSHHLILLSAVGHSTQPFAAVPLSKLKFEILYT
jgi:hypothetical protein